MLMLPPYELSQLQITVVKTGVFSLAKKSIFWSSEKSGGSWTISFTLLESL
jgi:hypothetical protein